MPTAARLLPWLLVAAATGASAAPRSAAARPSSALLDAGRSHASGTERGESEDTADALSRLASSSVEERRAAEVWLGRNLSVEDLAELAGALGTLGLEARARLASAIGSDDRHLALAVLLVCERDPALAALGERSLRRMVEAWWGSAELGPSGAREVASALAGHFPDRLLMMTVGAGSLDEELGRVVRHLGLPEGLPGAGRLPVALDPSLHVAGLEPDRERPHQPRALVRHPDDLLMTVIEAHQDATVEGFGMDTRRGWLHVVHRARAGSRDGAALLVEWCRTLVLDGEAQGARGARAEGAARALAGTGWPAAVEWLADRWGERGDRRALSGLLLAAERGRVAPALARRASVERLLAVVDEALARGGRLDLRFAEEVQRALGALGTLADGGDLAALLTAGFERASTAGRRLRLGALADLGRMPEDFAAGLRAQLASERAALPDELAVDCVRALALAPPRPGAPEPFVLRDPTPFFRRDTAVARLALLDHWLAASGARPPEAWRDPAAVAALEGGTAAIQRVRLVSWWLAAEPDGEAAAAHLAALATTLDAQADLGIAAGSEANAGDRLARLEQRAPLAPVFERARGRTAARDRLARLEVLAGGAGEALRAAVLEALIGPSAEPTPEARPDAAPDAGAAAGGPGAAAAVPEADLQVLGVLAADPEGATGEAARRAFLAGLGARVASSDPRDEGAVWITALERALRRLRGAEARLGQRTRVEDSFLAGLRSEMGDSTHPVAMRVRTGVWPRLPELEPVPLEALEVRLGP